jgi:type IV pilus biogenesis protein PilP
MEKNVQLHKSVLVALVAAVLPQLAAAQTGAADATSQTSAASTADVIAKLNAEGAILEARLRNATLQADIDRLTQKAPVAVQTPTVTATDGSAVAKIEDIHALSIGAFDGVYEARLQVSGEVVNVRKGDELQNGWKVVNIDDSAVTLVRGHEHKTLRV